jgi:hypothetical protein
VDVCATAELVKPAQVKAISIAKAVMGTKDPLRTKYLLISNLVWAWMADRYDPVVQLTAVFGIGAVATAAQRFPTKK